ncbi:MAG: YceI family protein [Actinomycetota bacterium]
MEQYHWTQKSTVQIRADSNVYPIVVRTHAISGTATCGEILHGQLIGELSGFVELEIRTLHSWNPLADFQMRRSVEVGRFPILRYELTQISGGPKRFMLVGALVFHGVRREFESDVRVHSSRESVVVEGTHEFNVLEFGVTPPRILNMQVYPDVRVRARLVAEPALL